jgi:hypothetical protein
MGLHPDGRIIVTWHHNPVERLPERVEYTFEGGPLAVLDCYGLPRGV